MLQPVVFAKWPASLQNKGLSAVVKNSNNTLLVLQIKYRSGAICSFSCVKEECVGMLKK